MGVLLTGMILQVHILASKSKNLLPTYYCLTGSWWNVKHDAIIPFKFKKHPRKGRTLQSRSSSKENLLLTHKTRWSSTYFRYWSLKLHFRNDHREAGDLWNLLPVLRELSAFHNSPRDSFVGYTGSPSLVCGNSRTLTTFEGKMQGWKKLMIYKPGIKNSLVLSTPLKNISQIGSSPQVGVNKKNVWKHHLAKKLICNNPQETWILRVTVVEASPLQTTIYFLRLGGSLLSVLSRQTLKKHNIQSHLPWGPNGTARDGLLASISIGIPWRSIWFNRYTYMN